MAYVTGICTSFEDIKNAIVSLSQQAGWAITTDSAGKTVLHKGDLYVMIDMGKYTYGGANRYDCVRIKGRTTLEGASHPYNIPLSVGISDFYGNDSYYPTGPVQFPVTFHGFYYSDIDEIYFVVTYNYIYQYIAFGKSNITLPGTGLWVSGTSACEGDMPYVHGDSWANRQRPMFIRMDPSGYGDYTTNGNHSPAIFWTGIRSTGNIYFNFADRNYWLHHNINGDPWSLATTIAWTDGVGVGYIERYLKSQPQQANNQAMLLPIMAYKTCAVYSSTYYHVATLQKARHIKINYLDPETVISNGDEQWVVFPWFKKVPMPAYAHIVEDTINGVSGKAYAVNHSGNYGWAIKKEA